jgi:hypothetical protein
MYPANQVSKMIIEYLTLLGGIGMMLTACSALDRNPAPAETRPDDFHAEYEWTEGSLPPPYHYEYTIRIGPAGEGAVEMIPDYPSDQAPVWVEEFIIQHADMDWLYLQMLEKEVFTTNWRTTDEPPVGGSSESLSVAAGGRVSEIPAYVVSGQEQAAAEIYAAIRSLVPQSIWEKLTAQRKKYMEEHPGP